jgi:hypothetical protein
MRRLAALVVVSLAAVGCMGGGENGVSRDDYIARADGVCGTYQVRLSRIPRPVTSDPGELGTFLERALPIAREQNDELEDLPRPSEADDRQQVEQLLALLDQELDFNEAAREAANEGAPPPLDSALQQGAAVSAEAGQLAEQLGFVVCARRT